MSVGVNVVYKDEKENSFNTNFDLNVYSGGPGLYKTDGTFIAWNDLVGNSSSSGKLIHYTGSKSMLSNTYPVTLYLNTNIATRYTDLDGLLVIPPSIPISGQNNYYGYTSLTFHEFNNNGNGGNNLTGIIMLADLNWNNIHYTSKCTNVYFNEQLKSCSKLRTLAFSDTVTATNLYNLSSTSVFDGTAQYIIDLYTGGSGDLSFPRFTDCKNIHDITIPNKYVSIPMFSLQCPNLRSVTFDRLSYGENYGWSHYGRTYYSNLYYDDVSNPTINAQRFKSPSEDDAENWNESELYWRE